MVGRTYTKMDGGDVRDDVGGGSELAVYVLCGVLEDGGDGKVAYRLH